MEEALAVINMWSSDWGSQVYCKARADPPELNFSSTIKRSDKCNSHCVDTQEALDVTKSYLLCGKVESQNPCHSWNLNIKP